MSGIPEVSGPPAYVTMTLSPAELDELLSWLPVARIDDLRFPTNLRNRLRDARLKLGSIITVTASDQVWAGLPEGGPM